MANRDDLIEKLQAERQGLLQEVQKLTEETASQRPKEGEWSPKEQLLHLIALEKLWLGWALQVRDQPGCEVGPVQPNPPSYPQANSRPLADIVAELEATRRDSMAAIAAVSEEELQRKGTHLSFGEMSVLQLLRALYRHDRMHAEQIAGREPSFQPRFRQQE